MNKFSCYTSRTGNVLSQQLQLVWRTAMLLLAAFLFSTSAIAQSHPACEKPNGDPDPPHCVSQDLQVIGAFLESSQCFCTSGDEITADLTMQLFNKTGSERSSFAVFAILVKTNPDGTTEREYFKDCVSPVPPGSTSTVTFDDAITYTCGQTLTLTDVYLAWTDASDGDRRQCGGEEGLLNNFCEIDPKCGKPADIIITPLLTASVTDTDATCEGETDGSITVEAMGGTGPYDFVLNPGNVTVSNDADGVYTFTGLGAGNYSIKVTDAEDCEITVQGTVAELPNPDAPTVAIDQPDCEDLSATITVTSSTAGLLFSFDGGAFAAYPAGGWVVEAGTNHTLVAQSTNGCISDLVNIEIDDAPIVPSGILTELTQPTCEVATGLIEVTSSTAGLLFSLDGGPFEAYPAGGYVVDPGEHTLQARSTDGCVSAMVTLDIDDSPIVPSGIVTELTHPTCEVATGLIEVTSSTEGLLFSLDGGPFEAYPAGGYVVDPGEHTLQARSTDGCVSAMVTVEIDDAPIVPAGITTRVVQPTCEALGSIQFLTPLGDYMYSIDGGLTYDADPFFGNLAPGVYALSVISGDECVTAAGEVTLIEPVCEAFEGCTLGYWKNHTGSWCDDYEPTDMYWEVFGLPNISPYNVTLLQALNSKGGGVYNLLRQSVAALLNACHPEVNYEWTEEEIIDAVQDAIANGTAGALASELDMMNNAGCPIDAHNRPISSSTSSSLQGIEKAEAGELRAYPTPFSDKATIEFTTAVDENYTVRLYDMRGALIKELKSGTAKAGVMNQVEVDGRNLPEGLYLGRVVSDSGSQTVKLLLKR